MGQVGCRRHHYDLAGTLISETDDIGAAKRDYIHMGSVPVAQIDTGGVTDTISYLHNDHLNTPRRATDAAGTVVWQWNSDAFGTSATNEDPDNDSNVTIINLRFPGQYYDAETALHYNYFRYYDPSTGRYVTSDPIGLAGGLNTYAYVGGNPNKFSDPFGLANPGAITYTATRVLVVPAINLGVRRLTAGRALTLGDWLYGVFNESANEEECAAQGLPDLTGKSEDEVEEALEEAGFKKKDKKTSGGYQEWKHPDGSIINIRPDGEISRAGPRRPPTDDPHNSPWYRPRYDQNGKEIPYDPGSNTHGTGELIIK